MIETSAFGLGGTTKTIPEIIDQIVVANEYLEKAMQAFMESRNNRLSNKGYFSNDGTDYLNKIVEYQNRINNRIGKLWIVYNKEVSLYHKDRKAQLGRNLPSADDPILSGSGNPAPTSDDDDDDDPPPPATVEQGYVYLADDNYTAEDPANDIDLILGKKYLVVYGEIKEGWVYVRRLDNDSQGFVPVSYLDISSASMYIISSGKTYKAMEMYTKENDTEISVTQDNNYLILDSYDNGWSLVQDLATSDTGNVPTVIFSNNETPTTRFLNNFYYIYDSELLVKYYDGRFLDVDGNFVPNIVLKHVEDIEVDDMLQGAHDDLRGDDDYIPITSGTYYVVIHYDYDDDNDSPDIVQVKDNTTGDVGWTELANLKMLEEY